MKKNIINFMSLGLAVLLELSVFCLWNHHSALAEEHQISAPLCSVTTYDDGEYEFFQLESDYCLIGIKRTDMSGTEYQPAASIAPDIKSMTDKNGIKAAALFNAKDIAKPSVNNDQPSNPETLGTAYITLANSGKYTIGYSNDQNEIIITGVKSGGVNESCYVLLACSLAALGAAFMFIWTRSRCLSK